MIIARANPHCFGHQNIEECLLEAINEERLPHALLFAGPKGVGKATFAYRLTRFILSLPLQTSKKASSLDISPESGIFKRVYSLGHADFLVLEPASQEGQKNKQIHVEDVRKAIRFAHKTPIEGRWKVILIDSADDLNKNAANALLKLLEEPPAYCVVILISHHLGALPLTIRSRCQVLQFHPLDSESFGQAVSKILPLDVSQDILDMAQNIPGRAFEFYEKDGVKLYQHVLTFLMMTIQGQGERTIYGLQKVMEARQENWPLFQEYFEELIQRYIHKQLYGLEKTFFDEEKLFRLMNHQALFTWVEVWEKSLLFFKQARIYNLDWRGTLTGISHIFAGKIAF